MSENLLTSLPETQKRSAHSSSTNAGSGAFHRWDIAAAKVLVKRLVRSGLRKGPSDMLLLTDSALNEWYNEEAVAFLHEQYARRQAERGVIEINELPKEKAHGSE